MKRLIFVCLIFALLLCFTNAQSTKDSTNKPQECQPCPISNDKPVCGDGITYSSECVAQCAKATKIVPGKCKCK